MTTSITSRYIDNMPSDIRTGLVEVMHPLGETSLAWVTEYLDLAVLLENKDEAIRAFAESLVIAVARGAWKRVVTLSQLVEKYTNARNRLASLMEDIKALPAPVG